MLDVSGEKFDFEKNKCIVLDIDRTSVDSHPLSKISKEFIKNYPKKQGIIQPKQFGISSLGEMYRHMNNHPAWIWEKIHPEYGKMAFLHEKTLMDQSIDPIQGIHYILDLTDKYQKPHIYLTQGITKVQNWKLDECGLLERTLTNIISTGDFSIVTKHGMIELSKEHFLCRLPQIIGNRFGINIAFSDILYIDDKPDPIVLARMLGINAFFYNGDSTYGNSSIPIEWTIHKLSEVCS